MVSILDLPTEILWIIAHTLQGGEISALARTHRILYPKLRLALIKYNISHQNSSALHRAARTNNNAFAKTLLSYRANVNALVDDLSPLMIAAQYDSVQVIDHLLRKETLDVNMQNAEGSNALWYGVAKKSYAAVNRLLQDPHAQVDILHAEGQTVLRLAVFLNRRNLVSLLLSRGGYPGLKAWDGMCPWIQACIGNRQSIKYLLLDHMEDKYPGIVFG